MAEQHRLSSPPKGLMRLAARFPIVLFRARLGWLLFGRFVMVVHRGRVSGKARRVVLEVVDFDRPHSRITVASGWGRKADWYKNVIKTPMVSLMYGTRFFSAEARELSIEEAYAVMRRYADKHPAAFRSLGRMMLRNMPEDIDEACKVISETLPFIAFEWE